MFRPFAWLLIAALALPSLAFAQAAAGGPALGFASAGANFAALRSSGAVSVKLIADWSSLEPTKGRFAWKPLDDAIAGATAAGLRVVIVLTYTPKWASLATGAELNNPQIYSHQPAKRIADWEAFVTAIVGRYKTKVRDWQVWTALSLPLYRGTTSDYLALLRAARARSKAADPASRIVLSTPLGVDLASVRRALAAAGGAFDAVSLHPQGISPEAIMRYLAVLRERVLGPSPKQIWMEWDPRSVGDASTWASQMTKVLAVSRAFGVDQVFWAAPPSPEIQAARRTFEERVGSRPFVGYIERPGAVVLAFGEAPTSLVAWRTGAETQVDVEPAASIFAPSGENRPQAAAGDTLTVTLTAEPLLITDAGTAIAAAAKATFQTRGLPLPPSTRSFAAAAEVSARLGRANVENGLYNMPFRDRRNGAVEVVDVDGSEAVRTNASKDIVFVYFDVDDTFLFFVDNRAAVEVSIEVRGAGAPQQLGFNLLYDSTTGYRFTPWHWVEPAQAWVTYTFRITDANFANTWGWDFAINAGGNRREDLTIRTVTVRKVVNP